MKRIPILGIAFFLGSLFVGFIFLSIFIHAVSAVHDARQRGDGWCSRNHSTNSYPPMNPTTAFDYFQLGNYDYDLGNCEQAVKDYSHSIVLNPNYPQAYNNRAYTNMRLRDYSSALADLNKAIQLRPDYVNALNNRGDLYNAWGPVIDHQKALEDYNKVISLGAIHDNSVCGHKAMAETNNKIPLAFLKFFLNRGNC